MAERAPTVGDLLRINRHLYVACSCGRQVRLSAAEAVRRFGLTTPFDGLRRRLVCSGCGRHGRHGFITAWPCSLDLAAWQARETHAEAVARGDRDEAERYGPHVLERLQRLLGEDGALGGDGPVPWPPRAGADGHAP